MDSGFFRTHDAGQFIYFVSSGPFGHVYWPVPIWCGVTGDLLHKFAVSDLGCNRPYPTPPLDLGCVPVVCSLVGVTLFGHEFDRPVDGFRRGSSAGVFRVSFSFCWFVSSSLWLFPQVLWSVSFETDGMHVSAKVKTYDSVWTLVDWWNLGIDTWRERYFLLVCRPV
jgi:hypothetical protein